MDFKKISRYLLQQVWWFRTFIISPFLTIYIPLNLFNIYVFNLTAIENISLFCILYIILQYNIIYNHNKFNYYLKFYETGLSFLIFILIIFGYFKFLDITYLFLSLGITSEILCETLDDEDTINNKQWEVSSSSSSGYSEDDLEFLKKHTPSELSGLKYDTFINKMSNKLYGLNNEIPFQDVKIFIDQYLENENNIKILNFDSNFDIGLKLFKKKLIQNHIQPKNFNSSEYISEFKGKHLLIEESLFQGKEFIFNKYLENEIKLIKNYNLSSLEILHFNPKIKSNMLFSLIKYQNYLSIVDDNFNKGDKNSINILLKNKSKFKFSFEICNDKLEFEFDCPCHCCKNKINHLYNDDKYYTLNNSPAPYLDSIDLNTIPDSDILKLINMTLNYPNITQLNLEYAEDFFDFESSHTQWYGNQLHSYEKDIWLENGITYPLSINFDKLKLLTNHILYDFNDQNPGIKKINKIKVKILDSLNFKKKSQIFKFDQCKFNEYINNIRSIPFCLSLYAHVKSMNVIDLETDTIEVSNNIDNDLYQINNDIDQILLNEDPPLEAESKNLKRSRSLEECDDHVSKKNKNN